MSETQLIYTKDRQIDHRATGEKMRWAIKEVNTTQQAIADKLNVSPSYVSDLINGKRNWSEAVALKVSRAINGKKRKKP